MVEEISNTVKPDAIYKATLDNRFRLEVLRTTDREGTLRLFDTKDNDKLLLEKDVDLMYGAIFGPDVCDVNYWQELTVEFVDKMK